jgi:hypothetical protein
MTSQKKHLNQLLAVLLAVIMLLIPACNVPFNTGVSFTPTAVREVPVTPPPPTITPTAEVISPMQQFLRSLQAKDLAPVGLPTIVDKSSPGSGAQQQVDYFRQVLDTVSASKQINTLTPNADYAMRGLLPGETVQNVIVIQYVDSLTTAFILTSESNGAHTYFIDPQGSVFELYLFAQNNNGTIFFESDPSKAQTILDMPDLTSAQWITVRQLTSQDKTRFSAADWAFLQAQYTEMTKEVTLDDAVAKGPVWLTVPVMTWDAQHGTQTTYISPASFDVHVEQNSAYLPGKTDRGVTLILPLGKFPSQVQSPTEQVTETPAPPTATSTNTPKPLPTKKPGKNAKKTPTPKGPTATPSSTPDNSLQQNMDAFQKGEVLIPNEKLFHSSTGASSLGVADSREVGMSWGFFVQGVYLGSFDIQNKNVPAKTRVAVFGFTDGEGKRFFIPFQLGVDMDHSIIIQYDPNRTISALDNERPITLKVSDTLDVLRANMNEPVLFFVMRAAPPFPFSDSDGYYIQAHEAQYNVADQALRFVKTASGGSLKQMQLPGYVNTLKVQNTILPLTENLILPQKP